MKSKIHKAPNNNLNGSKTKMKLMASLKIWLAIFPSITLFQMLFGKVLIAMPLLQRNFMLTVVLVPWVVFIGVPFIDFLMRQFGVGRKK